MAIKDMAGTVVVEILTTVDSFGYWQTTLTVPAEYTDNSTILAAYFEEEDELYMTQRSIGVR